MSKTGTTKPSVRISLNSAMNEAIQFLQNTRYPFMKEDEIFKLSFSRLYAIEYDNFEKNSMGYTILEAIRKKKPGFAKEWLESRGIHEKSITTDHIISMIEELL